MWLQDIFFKASKFLLYNGLNFFKASKLEKIVQQRILCVTPEASIYLCLFNILRDISLPIGFLIVI